MNRSLDNPLIEKAIKFLSKKIDAFSVNPKPVVYHSIRVGFLLRDLGYSDNIFIAGVLHDACEDAGVAFEEIEREFNAEICHMVQANTFDDTIQDKRNRHLDCFRRCSNLGKGALIVKAADIYENSFYYHLAKDKESFERLLEKVSDFISISEETIGNESIFPLLKEQYLALSSIYTLK